MTQISKIDLQILHLGIIGNGKFNENDIAKSDLSKLGVGRILDELASLKERNLIVMNKDGSFSVTEDARNILWNKQIPLEVKILHVLEISPQKSEDISSILAIPEDRIQKSVLELQKNHLVLMSTIKNESGIVRMYEILREGKDYLKNYGASKNENPSDFNPQKKTIEMLQKAIEEIKVMETSEDSKNKIISYLLSAIKNLEG